MEIIKGILFILFVIAIIGIVVAIEEKYDDTNYMGYNIINITWVNSTNFNATQICLGNTCKTIWGAYNVTYESTYNSTYDSKVNKAGDTMTGDLHIDSIDPDIFLNDTGSVEGWRIGDHDDVLTISRKSEEIWIERLQMSTAGVATFSSNITADAIKLGDNNKMYFGDSDDWCMYFDGVSLLTSNSC